MTKLLPLLVIVALFLASVSVARAQVGNPTVSTVEITSDPGTDDTYALGDTIEVGLTFSDEIVVTGNPRITVEIGTNQRVFSYSSTAIRQVTFSYTVVAGEADDDGIEVVVNSLALNGGFIGASDLMTTAALGHSSHHATGHLVDGIIPTVVLSHDARFVQIDWAFEATLTFSEPVYRLTASDFSVTNGSARDPEVLPATTDFPLNSRWEILIQPASMGPVTVTLPADSVGDASGNGNAVSNVLDVVAALPTLINVVAVTPDIVEGDTAEFILVRTRPHDTHLTTRITISQMGDYVSSTATTTISQQTSPDFPEAFNIHSTPFAWNVLFREGVID